MMLRTGYALGAPHGYVLRLEAAYFLPIFLGSLLFGQALRRAYSRCAGHGAVCRGGRLGGCSSRSSWWRQGSS
ncbi:MAG: hypothetical protein V8Q43_04435 [Christensenellaceae bacterium]